MTKDEFLKEVRKEIKHLRKHTTEEERNRLIPEGIEYWSTINCIYGMLTGHCNSKRAVELYDKIYNATSPYRIKKVPFKEQSFKKGNSYTSLEKYLFMVEKKQVIHVANYIKRREHRLYLKGSI